MRRQLLLFAVLLLPAAISCVPLPPSSLSVIPVAHCSAVGDGLKAAHVGNGAVFGVQVRDAFGKSVQVCDRGGHNFFVRARTLGAASGPWCQMGGVPYPLTTVNSKVTCQGLQLLWRGCDKGTYAWEYVPQHAGFVELSVQVSLHPSHQYPSCPFVSVLLCAHRGPVTHRFLIAMVFGRTYPACRRVPTLTTAKCCFLGDQAQQRASFL